MPRCPCPQHPFGCYGHPDSCGCTPPSETISMQDVRLVAGEGKLSAHTVLDAVNVILRQRQNASER
jgi:hypothetical protein